MSQQKLSQRYFVSYTGVKLPLRLINELDARSLDQRITYFTGYYNNKNQLMIIEKVVYGEIEFSHHYEYDENGKLIKAIMVEDDEQPRTPMIEPTGKVLEPQCTP